jgi:DNA repair photolyase|uniref:DNA repair photolyase n=1 Tax=Myoviridae sp. ct25F5 TaxID=2826604 RepID=A0A8S5LSZ8_9CAUD|nr:MAG TPA: DNA repair photolyase [Myoviridae sp. ct25F5]
METIKRKTMLYRTGVEYGDYTMNHVQGCAHGCLYPCYAYMLSKRFGKVKSQDEWCAPKLVENTLELLDAEIPKLKKRIRSVQLCFTTDPFMVGYPEVGAMSVAAIQRLNAAGIKCTVLTKGILPSELLHLSRTNEYGITLVSLDEHFREEYEPHTAPLLERLAALRNLHNAGCRTWVSIEPYPTPNLMQQELDPLLEAVSFVDKIIFGKMNYNKNVTAYPGHQAFYNACVDKVVEFCQRNNIDYHIKERTYCKNVE